MIKPKINMIGKVFGRLQVEQQVPSPRKTSHEAWYLCRCQCGNTIITRGSTLRNGMTASCGCLRNEVTRKRNIETAMRKYDLTGRRFSSLVTVEPLEARRAGARYWKCHCDCGNTHNVTTSDLLSGAVKSCGCRPCRVPDDLTGMRFGRLTALYLLPERNSYKDVMWHCVCDCGKECNATANNLRRGNTASCGCIRRDDLTNQRFGNLVVLSLGDKSNRGKGSFWLCQCDCGSQCQVHGSKLKSGHTSSCGCSHKNLIVDLTGQTFGSLKVLQDSGKRRSGSGGVLWRCQCNCGQVRDIRQDSLLSGASTSCGCTRSRGNKNVAELLLTAGIDFVSEYSPPDMPGQRRFDFAVLDRGTPIYFIEYDGVLHSQFTNSGWDTEERFQKTRASDQEKNTYCTAHQIPLIRIPYTAFKTLSPSDLVPETTPYLYQTDPVK